MTTVTLTVALIFAAIALSRRTYGTALGVVVMSMLLWPEYLRVPVGVADMSVPRLVGMALLIKLLIRGQHHQLRRTSLDVIVFALWIWTVVATTLAGAAFGQIAQMIGRGFDTVMMYLIARLSLHTPGDVKGFRRAIAITAIAMCAFGLYEAITASSPYRSLVQYRGWTWIDKPPEFRWGLLRAQASTSVSIFFGMAMMLLLGLLIATRRFSTGLFNHRIAVIAALLAALSSMSSGPWLACALLFAFMVYERRPGLIRPSVWAFVWLALLLEFASNRHFYNLVDYLALNPHNAWYRTRLLEIAAMQLHEYWLFGVGDQWPHHWAAYLDGRGHIDVVNNFLIIALYGGLPGMLLYIASHALVLRSCGRAWRGCNDPARRNLIFGFGASLVALDFASISVGLFGPPLLLSYVLLGILLNVTDAWRDKEVCADDNELNVMACGDSLTGSPLEVGDQT